MTGRDEGLRRRLLAMIEEDDRVRAELAAAGSLEAGYHPRMEAVHRRNAERLAAILEAMGWPGRRRVGDDGEEAAWRIVQHAIGRPAFMRRALALLHEAVAADEAPAWQAAMLEDRIRFFEGRPQAYGTQLDWDEEGRLMPIPSIENPADVDRRRRQVGLEPLADYLRRKRSEARDSGERPPDDPVARAREVEAWARSVGWRN